MKRSLRPLVLSVAALVGIVFMLSWAAKSEAWSADLRASAATDNDSPLGKATFSATVDGVAVSGGAIDGLQQANAAHIVPDDNGGAPKLRFWLFDTKKANETKVMHSFRIEVPNKTGVNQNSPMKAHMILSNGHSAHYESKNAVVTITSISSTRVTGTFSGKFSVPHDTPYVSKTEIMITDGKFDIPMATIKAYPN